MSICIAIAVPDGIALAADSQTTWNKSISKVKEKGTGREVELEVPIDMPISWSRMSRKLVEFKVGDKSYAVCLAGTALLNQKTTYSIIKSFESKYDGETECNKIADYFISGFKDEMKKHLNVDDLKKAQQVLRVHFILAGYDGDDISKPLIESHMIFSGNLVIDGKDNDTGHIPGWTNKGQNMCYGGCWIGRTDFINYMVSQNTTLPPIQGQYELLSLEDAIDYTKFLVDFTCDYQRFAIMVPDCGKPIISARLTPNGYEEVII